MVVGVGVVWWRRGNAQCGGGWRRRGAGGEPPVSAAPPPPWRGSEGLVNPRWDTRRACPFGPLGLGRKWPVCSEFRWTLLFLSL